MSRYGYSLVDWNKAKEEMRQILIERVKAKAEAKRVISYSDLVAEIQIIDLRPESYALAAMLEEVSKDEDIAGRGMLTVIVVHKSGDMHPGTGFFKLAKKLGRNISDKEKCWIDELDKVRADWGVSD